MNRASARDAAQTTLTTEIALLRQEYGQLREMVGELRGKLDTYALMVQDPTSTPAGKLIAEKLDRHDKQISYLQRGYWVALGVLSALQILVPLFYKHAP